jgi:prenyltransferase/squalene oxidase-like repeat protein
LPVDDVGAGVAEESLRSASSLGDYIDLLLPGEAGALISEAALTRLRRQALALPPVPRIAVECRLAAGADQVDLQLCLRRDVGDYPTLADYADELARERPADAGAAGLAAFARRLADPASRLHQGIAEVFLEYDLPEGADLRQPPAVFLSLPADQDAARAVVAEALSLLRPAAAPRLAEPIARCFAACEGDAAVAHLGVMLSRPIDAVRVNVKGLRPAQIAPYLAACVWPGDLDQAAALFDWAADTADRVTLALDVGEALLPRIGVECFNDMQPRANPAWRVRLGALCDAGLCAPDKAEAFLRMPATRGPSRARPWPADLMAESLLRPDDELTALARRLVHVKITETAGAHREAKAYFGAGVITFTPGGRRGMQPWRPALAQPRPRRSLEGWAVPETPVERSLALALRFLLNAQLQSGLWRDFHVPTGVSDEWVSGFIGAQLAGTGNAAASAAAREALGRLRRRQRAHGGWGYNGDHPCDADSTAWVLRLAVALGEADPPTVGPGAAFIRGHCRDDGALATYVDREGVVAITGLPEDASLAGWLFVHDCVTAAAAPFLPARSTDYLRSRQAEDGAWTGYWWTHPAYPTWMACEALRLRPAPGDAARLARAEDRARDWIEAAVRAPGAASAFDVACALRVLLGGGGAAHRRAIEAGGRWLIDRQEADGAWNPGAGLRIPAWRRLAPEASGEMICLDRRAGFTTAAAYGALAALHRAGITL